MKKPLYLSLLAVCLGWAATAQVGQKGIMVGGGINYIGQKNEVLGAADEVIILQEDNYLNLSARGGYFLSNNFLLGLSFGIGSGDSRYETRSIVPVEFISTTQNSSSSVGVFARLYKMLGSGKFAVFGQAGLNYVTGRNTSTKVQYSLHSSSVSVAYSREESTGVNLVIQPGVTYFLTPNIAVETYFGNLGYQISTTRFYDSGLQLTGESGNSGLNAGLTFDLRNIWLGFNFYFGGGNKSSSPK